ncbi:hypothetical protein [Kutzneria buriramensis]|uniref:hypothetical protein n=1 Tax=Kutzneria buriramensis TaxID=1045776 RepID=UPI0014775482|nr:hypothetical protein [Kutzneria buriramensis]
MVVLAGGVVVVGRVGMVAGGGVVVGTGCVGTVVVVGGGVVVVVVVTVTVKRDPPDSLAPFGLVQVPAIAYVPGLASAGAVATTLPLPVTPAGDVPVTKGAPAQVKATEPHPAKPPQRMVKSLPAGPLAGATVTDGGATAAKAVAGAATPTQSAAIVTVRTRIRIVPIHCGAFGPNAACRR